MRIDYAAREQLHDDGVEAISLMLKLFGVIIAVGVGVASAFAVVGFTASLF